MTEPLEISDKIWLVDPNHIFGYHKPYSPLKRLYRWLRGKPTKEYVPGLLDAMMQSTLIDEVNNG